MNRRASLIAVVVSAACFGTLAVLTPLAYDAGAEPLPLLAWRFLFAALLLAGLVALRKPSDLLVSRGDFARYSALALTGYGAASVCFFFALKYADASVVAVLLYAYPALVTIASWLFLGEKATWQRAVAVVDHLHGLRARGRAARRSGEGVRARHLARLGCGGRLHALQPVLGPVAAGSLAARHDGLHVRDRSARDGGGLDRRHVRDAAEGASSFVGRLTAAVGSLSPAAWEPRAWALLAAIVIVPDVHRSRAVPARHPWPRPVAGSRRLDSRAAVHDRARRASSSASSWSRYSGSVPLLVLAGVVFAETSARKIEQPAAF